MQCYTGEADLVIAKNMGRPKAFAVLSNDSDFCVFKDCRFVPNDLFDLENDLQLGAPHLPEKPLRLRCAVISSEKVVQSLGVRDLAILLSTTDNIGGGGKKTTFERKLSLPLKTFGPFSVFPTWKNPRTRL